MKKSSIPKFIILVMALVVITVGSTYAYFTNGLQGSATETKGSAAKFDITSSLETANAISAPDLRLIESTEVATKAQKVNFTVENPSSSTIDGQYWVFIKDITITKNLYSEDFKWELLIDNQKTITGEFNGASGNFKDNATRKDATIVGEADNVPTTAMDMRLNSELTPITIPVGKTHNLELRLWLENADRDQLDLLNGSFNGKLYLEAAPKPRTTIDTSTGSEESSSTGADAEPGTGTGTEVGTEPTNPTE